MKIAAFFIVLLLLVTPRMAVAQSGGGSDDCIPGLPCVVDFTENDPDDPEDGPNADDAPNAPKHSSSDACDADFMNQIYAKSWLEAERSNVTAEILIRKPDSVLEYSCFNQMASIAATKIGPLFTEADDWDDKEVEIDGEINTEDVDQPPIKINTYMEDDRMDKAIEEVVLKSLKKYLENNFDHDFLGGFSQGKKFDTSGIDKISEDGYNCDYMNLVYFDAKCTNMNEDTAFDTFKEMTGLDRRVWPKECGGDTDLEEFEETIKVAENEDFKYVAFDRVSDTYFDRMYDVQSCQDSTPVPTGITFEIETFSVNSTTGDVTAGEGQQVEDKVCPKPGCYYDAQSGQCQ
ncbi:hypothetical protein N9Z27_01855 [Alphaproteobacteria bacterium]|nr:hypothetical protein [Alphaproteobacteria bacterium]